MGLIARDEHPDAGKPRGFQLRIAPKPSSVVQVRRALESLELPARVLHDAQLLASELVSNSVKHASLGPDDHIHVAARRSGGRLRVTVRDRPRPKTLAAIRPVPGAESGWGLYLIERVASGWGMSGGARGGYWFELELGPSSS